MPCSQLPNYRLFQQSGYIHLLLLHFRFHLYSINSRNAATAPKPANIPPAKILCAAPVAVAIGVVVVGVAGTGAGGGVVPAVATATEVMGANVDCWAVSVLGLMISVVFWLEPAPVWISVEALALWVEAR